MFLKKRPVVVEVYCMCIRRTMKCRKKKTFYVELKKKKKKKDGSKKNFRQKKRIHCRKKENKTEREVTMSYR